MGQPNQKENGVPSYIFLHLQPLTHPSNHPQNSNLQVELNYIDWFKTHWIVTNSCVAGWLEFGGSEDKKQKPSNRIELS